MKTPIVQHLADFSAKLIEITQEYNMGQANRSKAIDMLHKEFANRIQAEHVQPLLNIAYEAATLLEPFEDESVTAWYQLYDAAISNAS